MPLDRAVLPTGLAVAGDRLLVVSSDFDLAFEFGALLSADLGAAREILAGEENVARGAYTQAALIPPFGDSPVVTSGGERVYLPVRGPNRVIALDVAEDGALSCGSEASPPICGEGQNALQLNAADPFSVVLLEEERGDDGALQAVTGMVALLSSNEVTLFHDGLTERMQRTDVINLGQQVLGVRSLVLRPEVAGTDPVAIAAVETQQQQQDARARLIVFEPRPDGERQELDLTTLTGAQSVRDMVLVPGDDGDNDALLVVLRGPTATQGPEGIARFEIDDDGALPTLRLRGLVPTCRNPISVALAAVPAPLATSQTVHRVLLTCHDGDVIEAIDPLTLRTTDVVRFFGRGPYEVVVNQNVDPPEVYVSFHLDGSVGFLRFEDDGGLPRLVVQGRIGEAEPRPEDGRE